MSPTAFKQQIAQLVSELEKCDDLCQAIRSNRRLGSTSDALDLLQHDILNSATSIDSSFKALRSIIGSRMDLGDELARSKLNHSIRELQLTIQPRLSEIAYRRREGSTRDLVEIPGFRKLNERWIKIHYDVSENLESLGHRLKALAKSSDSAPTPKPAFKKSEPVPAAAAGRVARHDESIISNRQLDDLVAHMKMCWVEKEERGEVVYVNVFDEKKVQWERPSGYVKALESRRRVRVQDPAEHSASGWSHGSKGW
ncbi:hypothetical protein EG329_008752 [Mollisiaceae sp. DMI_Dod_QoI]|nr:hypothetical protein EG329_008752 [Helotiales sp. DMI_Dod_QoI]